MQRGSTSVLVAGALAASAFSGTSNRSTYTVAKVPQPVIGRPSIDEQKRRIAAAQLKRENRQARDLWNNRHSDGRGIAIQGVFATGPLPRLAAVAKRQKAKKTKHAIVKSIGKAGYRDAVAEWRKYDGGWTKFAWGKISARVVAEHGDMGVQQVEAA